MFGSLGAISQYYEGAPWAIAPDATVDFDFVNNRGFQSNVNAGAPATASSFFTVSRTGDTIYAPNSAGTYFPFTAGQLTQTDKGVLIEDSCANVALWCRDLTNAAWTKTNCTAALDQVGIDGVSNSASSITASSTSTATVLQSITSTSRARWQSAFVKRITGTGVVNMTMDNGSTWTAITLTTAWTRVQIPTQTLANPTVGFQLVTPAANDKIAVDFVQCEHVTSGIYAIPFATSPILTTSALGNRGASTVTMTTLPIMSSSNVSAYCDMSLYAFAASASTFPTFWVFNGTSGNSDGFGFGGRIDYVTFPAFGVFISSSGTNNGTPGGTPAVNTNFAMAGAFSTARTISCTNGTLGTASNNQPLTPATLAATATVGLSLPQHFQQVGFGWVRRVALWGASTLSDARLQSLTTTPF